MDVTAKVDIGQNITDLLGKLAAQIGTTADKVFPWYVKQQVLEGWIYLSVSTVALLAGALLVCASFRKADFDDDNGAEVLVYVGSVVAILSFIFLSLGFSNSVTQILNPNFHALESMTGDMAKLIGK